MTKNRQKCESIFRLCFRDFFISLKILLKLLVTFWFCLSVIQADYTRLFNLKRSTADKDSPSNATNVSRPRIFCLIFTSVERHDYIAIYGQSTWIRNCDRYLFVSNSIHPVLEPLVIKNRYRWGAMLISLGYVYRYYADEMDWLLKVNDDNFVILENLRKLLQPYSSDEPISFGCKMKNNENQTYMHGGNVFSREALRRLVTNGFTNSSLCYLDDSPYDDEELSRCLRNVGVVAGDSRDAMGRQRFLPFNPEQYLVDLEPDMQEWYSTRSYYEINAITRELSREVISFYNVNPPTMLCLYYYIYKMRIFGRKVLPQNGTTHFINGTPSVTHSN
ncbi:glycoprotein-N-acetylgalactosamine 3-beta-galactosyltransferase 1-like [Anastrepha obliqua]|uniref:glycoprotein-N-acetylgalactosamine 3-beta-galactosyltransferase 1-like n=1 Tax=Anastrepha obliqua TaxID=95512 RepID=UPI002409CF23|nr:glycoprotein-N-acetylgalactosamine 3-beta-galactosyltransferase 1-like [Anastrepha obliqua]